MKGDCLYLQISTLSALLSLSALGDELENAKFRQVDQQGYLEPQNYVVKLGQLSKREAKTERHGDEIVTTFDRRIQRALWPSYIHHEYAHACQMMLGGPSESVFMDEASATLQEMLAFPHSGAWQSSVEAFQSNPQMPPFVDTWTKFDYGGALFLLFLEQRFGQSDGRLVKRLWARASADLPHVDNVGWMKLIESETSRDMTDLILEFANWRVTFPDLKVITVASRSVHELFLTADDWPQPLGCVVVYVPAATDPRSLRMTIESLMPMGLSFRKEAEHGSSRLFGPSTETWAIDAGLSLHLSVCNLDKKSFMLRDLVPRPLKIFFDFIAF
jgi:hypothetical protein